MDKVNLAQKLSLFTDHYSPKIVGEVNDAYVKLAKLQGDFMWHHHDNEDELFFVVKGALRMKVRENDGEREFLDKSGRIHHHSAWRRAFSFRRRGDPYHVAGAEDHAQYRQYRQCAYAPRLAATLSADLLFHLSCIVGERLQHLPHRALKDRMPHLRRDLGQRFEHEPPLMHGDVRHI